MMRRGLIGLMLLMLAGIIAGPLNLFFYRPLTSNPSGFVMEVKPSTSATALVHQLYLAHLIPYEKPYVWLLSYGGYALHLKAGIYHIHPNESAGKFFRRLVTGDVYRLFFRIPEGFTQNQIDARLSVAPYLVYQALVWDVIKDSHQNAEGLLLADTYQYIAGEDAQALLLRANARLLQALDECWLTRDLNLPFKDPYELLIAASILEKEAADTTERRLMAGVLVNRLRQNMRLQMDPTVIYALNRAEHPYLHHEDLSVDSPYNTYRYQGLPPTPIAMVGWSALNAMAHPVMSKYLYYVAKGDGGHEFSETYEAHRAALSRYLKFKKSHEVKGQ